MALKAEQTTFSVGVLGIADAEIGGGRGRPKWRFRRQSGSFNDHRHQWNVEKEQQ
jgi:hypothetical protein